MLNLCTQVGSQTGSIARGIQLNARLFHSPFKPHLLLKLQNCKKFSSTPKVSSPFFLSTGKYSGIFRFLEHIWRTIVLLPISLFGRLVHGALACLTACSSKRAGILHTLKRLHIILWASIFKQILSTHCVQIHHIPAGIPPSHSLVSSLTLRPLSNLLRDCAN